MPQVVIKVFRSPHPKRTYKKLSKAGKRKFRRYTKAVHFKRKKVTKRRWTVPRVPARRAGEKCWIGTASSTAEAYLGNDLYTFNVEVYWCHRKAKKASKRVITYKETKRTWGEVHGVGWRWEKSDDKQYDPWSSGNKVRFPAQGHFVLGAGPWDIQNSYPCIRFNVEKGNEISSSLSCSST